MNKVFSITALFLVGISGCKTPQKAYFQQIQKLGVIPFSNPVAAIGSGTALRGKPGNVNAIAPPSRCFPDTYQGNPTDLRWVSEVIIPPTYKKMYFSFDANFNSMMAVGTPGVQFNLTATKIQTVELEIREAQIEMIDQLALKDFYASGMSESCKEMLLGYPFIMEALKVNAMSFTFFDAFGGKFSLTSANIGDFALFGGDVQWYIEQGSKLVVTTPKYIGYKLAQLRCEDEGFVGLTASEVQKGEYVWVEGIKEITPQNQNARLLPNGFELGAKRRITTTQ